MKRIILYPHIYTHLGKNALFLYNTVSHAALLVNNKDCKLVDIDHHCINISVLNPSILNKLLSEKWGYIIDTKISPIGFHRLNFTSSKTKFENIDPSSVGGNAIHFIERISLFVDSIDSGTLNPTIAQILDFPTSTAEDIDIYLKFLENYNFNNLKEIEIVSDTTSRAFVFLNTLISRGFFVSFRTTICNSKQIDKLLRYTSEFTNIYFKVFASINLKKDLIPLHRDNVQLKFWSTSISEIYRNPDIAINPIIYNADTQKELISESLLNIEDIMSLKRTLFDLKYNSIFNVSFFGKIVLQGRCV